MRSSRPLPPSQLLSCNAFGVVFIVGRGRGMRQGITVRDLRSIAANYLRTWFLLDLAGRSPCAAIVRPQVYVGHLLDITHRTGRGKMIGPAAWLPQRLIAGEWCW